MAWIESHQELIKHPKTKKLIRRLGVSSPTVVGHLHMLWWWAMDYAQDGDISRFDAEDIADAVEWDGPADVLVTALIESGFIDKEVDGLKIHDWYDYAGRLMEKREQNKERKRRSRKKAQDGTGDSEDVTRPSRARHADSSETGDGVTGLPYLTVPNQTIINNPPPPTEENACDDPRIEEPTEQEKPAYESYFKAHERLFGFPPSKSQRDELNDFIDVQGLDESVVVRALERADLRGGGYNFRLITGILHSYQMAGASSLDKAIAYDAAFEANKQARRSDSKVTPWRRRASNDERGRSDERVRGEYDELSL